MTEQTRPAPAEIRAFRAENLKMRERDIAAQLKISEAAIVAAEVGLTAVRIDGSAASLLERVASLGEVLALSRATRRPMLHDLEFSALTADLLREELPA